VTFGGRSGMRPCTCGFVSRESGRPRGPALRTLRSVCEELAERLKARLALSTQARPGDGKCRGGAPEGDAPAHRRARRKAWTMDVAPSGAPPPRALARGQKRPRERGENDRRARALQTTGPAERWLDAVISGREPTGPAEGRPDDRLRERARNLERQIQRQRNDNRQARHVSGFRVRRAFALPLALFELRRINRATAGAPE
jgi:hypothetical protein